MNKQTKTKTKKNRRRKFQKSPKCKNNQWSPMSNLSWCGLNIERNVLKVKDMCPNLKCKCQKQFTFTQNQFQVDGARFKNTMEKIPKGGKKHGIIFSSQQKPL